MTDINRQKIMALLKQSVVDKKSKSKPSTIEGVTVEAAGLVGGALVGGALVGGGLVGGCCETKIPLAAGALVGGALVGGGQVGGKAKPTPKPKTKKGGAKEEVSPELKLQMQELAAFKKTIRLAKAKALKDLKVDISGGPAQLEQLVEEYNAIMPGSGDKYRETVNNLTSPETKKKTADAMEARKVIKQTFLDRGYKKSDISDLMKNYTKTRAQRRLTTVPSSVGTKLHSHKQVNE